jgi:hypothetical protein
MKNYRNKEVVSAAKIAEVSGILQSNGGTSCVLRFEDGTSQQEDFAWFIKNNGVVGRYLVNYADNTRALVVAETFESMYEEVQ